MGALEMYDQLSAADTPPSSLSDGAAATQTASEGEVSKLQQRQREAIERHASQQKLSTSRSADAHPDLRDLDFIGGSSKLPPPIQPSSLSSPRSPTSDVDNRGSLSDYSDYTSDEEDHRAHPTTRKDYLDGSDDSDVGPVTTDSEDPFADPFADDAAVGASSSAR
jgi:LAS seventeen-binding protein 5